MRKEGGERTIAAMTGPKPVRIASTVRTRWSPFHSTVAVTRDYLVEGTLSGRDIRPSFSATSAAS